MSEAIAQPFSVTALEIDIGSGDANNPFAGLSLDLPSLDLTPASSAPVATAAGSAFPSAPELSLLAHDAPVHTSDAMLPDAALSDAALPGLSFEPAQPVAPAQASKVLVIDDSNTIRRSAEIFLKQGGYTVLLAEDGFDALAKINDHGPDLIFCDILMPRLDGYQTCAIIKRHERFKHVPVIMLSSKDGLFDKARGRMVGSQDYLTKPFTKDQLLRAVQVHLVVGAAAKAEGATAGHG